MEKFTAIIASIHDQLFDPARLPAAACALVFVGFMGMLGTALSGNANPFYWRLAEILFGKVGAKLDKGDRNPNDLTVRGLILTLTAMVVSFLIGKAFQILSAEYPQFLIIDIVALSLVLTVGTVWQSLMRLHKALETTDLVKGAFYTIAKTTRSNLTAADEFTITRVGVGMGAKSFDKGVVAPILWFLIAGLPAAFLYVGLAALSWRFGKEGFSRGFGAPMLALEKLMGFVPNVISGLLIALSGLITPTAGMTRAVFSLVPFRKGAAPYAEGGAAITAMAFALKVSLGGPTLDLDGSVIKRGWVGPKGATAQIGAKHLHRGLYILVIAHLLFLFALLAAIVLGARSGITSFFG